METLLALFSLLFVFLGFGYLLAIPNMKNQLKKYLKSNEEWKEKEKNNSIKVFKLEKKIFKLKNKNKKK